MKADNSGPLVPGDLVMYIGHGYLPWGASGTVIGVMPPGSLLYDVFTGNDGVADCMLYRVYFVGHPAPHNNGWAGRREELLKITPPESMKYEDVCESVRVPGYIRT